MSRRRPRSPNGAVNGASSSTTKRAKLSAEGPGASGAFARESILAESSGRLRDDFAASKPYLHAVAQDLFDDGLLRDVRKEIYQHLEFSLKETDIYRVYQTGDLANLDGLDAAEALKLGSIQRLRDALYSPAFRAFLSEVTSCGPLSGKQTDMSINDYRQGCHLLNHDDVIGTRRVSYILYLTNPDDPWTREDGGALELYPVERKGTPANRPAKIIPPRFNQFTFFTVQPGHSFHSVEEVFAESKARLSISGWFHLPHDDEPGYEESQTMLAKEAETAQGASLQQLKGKGEELFAPVPPESAAEMTEEDLQHLKKYLNPAYLAGPSVSQVCDRFADDSHITLSKFLSASFATRLRNAIRVSEASCATESVVPDHSSCLADGDWTLRGPPHRQRFLVPSGANSTISTKLLDELRQLFSSAAFLKWLRSATTLVPAMAHILPRRFRPGLDYTLATASEVPLLELEMSLTPSAGWDDGEVGGWGCFMPPADDDTEADPAVYSAAKASSADDDDDQGQGGALLTTYPSWNQLVLVLRDPGVLTFTKYVSVRAGESRWDVSGQYTLVDDDDSDDAA